LLLSSGSAGCCESVPPFFLLGRCIGSFRKVGKENEL
jgi:hypothetical protein